MTYTIAGCTVNKFLMMGRGIFRNVQSFIAKEISEISAFSWFYYKDIFYDARSYERKKKYVQILTQRVKFQITLEISREICPPVGSTGIISVRYELPPFCWPANVYKSLSREIKNCFMGSCVDEMLGNTELEAYILKLQFYGSRQC